MQEKTTTVPPPVALAEPADHGVRQRVLDLALPAVAEQILNMSVGLVDTYLVGHLGAAALASVGLGNQIVMLATAFFAAVATGATALVARHYGAREPETANRILHQSMMVVGILAVFITALAYALARPSMILMGAEGEVIDLSTQYLQIVAPSLLASAFMFVGNAAMRGSGDTRTPMVVMAVVNGVNAVVAYVLINGLGPFAPMGVAGSALGAAFGRTTGALLVITLLLRGRDSLRFRRSLFWPDRVQLGRIVNLGVPAGAEMFVMRFGQTMYAAVVASLGTAAFAAHQVALNSESLSFSPGFGFAVAATTLVGQGLGARSPRQAEEGAYTSLKLALAIMASMGAIFFLFAPQFLGFFTEDAYVIALGIGPLMLVGLTQPFLGMNMVLAGSLRGAGDTRYPLLVTLIGIWGIRIPVAYLLAQTPLGLMGAWIGMCADLVVRALFLFFRFRSGKWKTIRV